MRGIATLWLTFCASLARGKSPPLHPPNGENERFLNLKNTNAKTAKTKLEICKPEKK